MSASWITATTVLGVCVLMMGLNLLLDIYFDRFIDWVLLRKEEEGMEKMTVEKARDHCPVCGSFPHEKEELEKQIAGLMSGMNLYTYRGEIDRLKAKVEELKKTIRLMTEGAKEEK